MFIAIDTLKTVWNHDWVFFLCGIFSSPVSNWMLPFRHLWPLDGGVNLKMRGLTEKCRAGGIELPKFKAKKGDFGKLFEWLLTHTLTCCHHHICLIAARLCVYIDIYSCSFHSLYWKMIIKGDFIYSPLLKQLLKHPWNFVGISLCQNENKSNDQTVSVQKVIQFVIETFDMMQGVRHRVFSLMFWHEFIWR